MTSCTLLSNETTTSAVSGQLTRPAERAPRAEPKECPRMMISRNIQPKSCRANGGPSGISEVPRAATTHPPPQRRAHSEETQAYRPAGTIEDARADFDHRRKQNYRDAANSKPYNTKLARTNISTPLPPLATSEIAAAAIEIPRQPIRRLFNNFRL
jgi:hypothetical protein